MHKIVNIHWFVHKMAKNKEKWYIYEKSACIIMQYGLYSDK